MQPDLFARPLNEIFQNRYNRVYGFKADQNQLIKPKIKQEIIKLKAEGVEEIIFDLRNNGGGSLEAAIEIVGLFIERGPVVQVKQAGGKAQILPDSDPKVQWEGPLVVMINNYSASASEIFAAAIQDYNRGIIIGSKQSYGKGTVQNVFELNELISILLKKLLLNIEAKIYG